MTAATPARASRFPFTGFPITRAVGKLVTQASQTSGYGLRLMVTTAALLPHALRRRRMRAILDLLFQYLTAALPVTAFVSTFTGMILALSFGISLQQIGQEQMLGWAVAVPMVREMGPFMTALILSASIGSGIAAELGTMRVSEEIDALEIMSISPVSFLVLPRFVALIIVGPVMTIFAAVIGIGGGALVSLAQFGVEWEVFRYEAMDKLADKDLFTGLILKALVFGVTIAIVSCTQGLRARGGATGVGNAARRAVVVTFLLVLFLGYFITWLFYRL